MTEFKYFIAIIKPFRKDFITDPDESEMAVMEEHYMYLKTLMEKDKLILAGPTLNESNPFGTIILKTSSKKEAKTLLYNDPSIVQKIQQVVEFEPFKVSLSNL
jgi:uncharacterized protein YciI